MTVCLICAALLLCVLVLLSVRVGSVNFDRETFLGALSGDPAFANARVILLAIRIPHATAAIGAGVGLSLAGLLLQCVTDNALAGPNIIGVNAGAGFASVAVLAFVPGFAASAWGLPFVSFLGAVAATAVIVLLSRHGRGGRAGVILAGAALTALLNAGISTLTVADPDLLVSYHAFSVGGFEGVTMGELSLPLCMIALCVAIAVLLAPRSDVLCLGDTAATLLGIRVGRLRLICILCASAAAGAVVSFAGLLGFVGLIVPHMARSLAGTQGGGGMGRRLTVFCVLLGACVTLSADLLGRILLAPTVIPVGIMMAFVGAPFFLYLIWKTNK